ncbi:thioredoxin [Candidatus Thorarchaeota archaeon]|nr:MAG: thioredoxin [Candidatus Thorarchaeota archaeon]
MSPNDKENSDFENLTSRLEERLSGDTHNSFANGQLNEIRSDNNSLVIDKYRTSLLLIYRNQCPYCKQLMPKLAELAKDYRSQVFFAKINIDTNRDVAERFHVLGVPLVIALKKGHPVDRIEGLRNIAVYDDWINQIHRGIRPTNFEKGSLSKLE